MNKWTKIDPDNLPNCRVLVQTEHGSFYMTNRLSKLTNGSVYYHGGGNTGSRIVTHYFDPNELEECDD